MWGALVGGGVAMVQDVTGHAGHLFADEQGATAILPGFQIGLFAALWVVVVGCTAWRRAARGLGVLVWRLAPAAWLAAAGASGPATGLAAPWYPACRVRDCGPSASRAARYARRAGFFAVDRRALPDLAPLRPVGFKIGLELSGGAETGR